MITVKVVVLGSNKTGKSSFVRRVVRNETWDTEHVPYVENCEEVAVECRGRNTTVVLKDTKCGDDCNVAEEDVLWADCALILVDLTNEDSLGMAQKLCKIVKEQLQTPLVLVGNKSDATVRQVDKSVVKHIASGMGAKYVEVSVKGDKNLKESLAAAVDLCTGDTKLSTLAKLKSRASFQNRKSTMFLTPELPQLPYPKVVNTLVVGSSGSGKTAIISNAIFSETVLQHEQTFEETFTKQIPITWDQNHKTEVLFCVTELGGVQPIEQVQKRVVSAEAIILVLDLTSHDSLLYAGRLLDCIAKTNCTTLLVGNKCDAETSCKQIGNKSATDLARLVGGMYIECCAHSHQSATAVFYRMACTFHSKKLLENVSDKSKTASKMIMKFS